MISSSSRTIRQYCSVCKATLDMAIVETGQAHEVTWLKCPQCDGILPHLMSKDEPQDTAEATASAAAAAASTPAVAPAPAGIPESEKASARDYDPAATYEVGEVVYHRSFNRWGRVAEKTTLAGKRSAIRLEFDGGESMTLREGV
jgi:hypothetical protein